MLFVHNVSKRPKIFCKTVYEQFLCLQDVLIINGLTFFVKLFAVHTRMLKAESRLT